MGPNLDSRLPVSTGKRKMFVVSVSWSVVLVTVSLWTTVPTESGSED